MSPPSLTTVVDNSQTPPKPKTDQVSARALEAYFGSPTAQLVPASVAAQFLTANPLTEANTVETATEAIVAIQDFAAKSGKIVRYPRNLLKVQHLVAFLLVNPFATVGEVCRFFSISPATYDTLSKSDTFKQLMESHGSKILKALPQDIGAKMKDTLDLATDKVQQALLSSEDGEYALSVLDKVANRLGMGAKHQQGAQVNVNIVTADMIAAAKARRITPSSPTATIDVTPSASEPGA